MKKVIVFILVFGLVLIGYLNYNYPFFTQKIGKWSVGYSFAEKPLIPPEILAENIISYTELDQMLNSKDNYIADPFFIYEEGQFYLFTELKGNENADIALFTSSNGKEYQYKGIVLDEDFHISYPQVFKYEGEYFMLPETKQSGNVLLYKAYNFPFGWKIEDTLIKDRKLKDASVLLSKQQKLIVAVDDQMQQFMFESDSLTGTWQESENFNGRKGNETRPGGRFFEVDGDWYLPIQDRTYGYGSGISIYKLDNTGERIELIISKKRFLKEWPDIKWFNRGMHHLDIQKVEDKYYMVYDGDRNVNGEKSFQIKRTLKYNFYDLFH